MSGRRRRGARSAGAAAAALALAWGCALDGGARDPWERGARRPPSGWEQQERERRERVDRAYDDGYARGWGDREQGRSPDHERWASDYDRRGEASFRTGYADGYQRRPHRYGAAGPEVAPVAPAWLVGAFRGWDEHEDVPVELVVRRDGHVRLTGGGRAQEGVYRAGRLELARGVWRVERVRGGLLITPESDRYGGVRLTRQ